MQHVLPRAARATGESLELGSSLTRLAASSHKSTRAGPPRPAEGRALAPAVASQILHCPASLAASVFTGKEAFLHFVGELTTSTSWGSVRKILSQAGSLCFGILMASLSVQGPM